MEPLDGGQARGATLYRNEAELNMVFTPAPMFPTEQLYLPTWIVRHRRENRKKCSLRPLEKRNDFCFSSYPAERAPSLPSGYLLLAFDAPPVTRDDRERGLLLLDATWRYAAKMERWALAEIAGLEQRSLPSEWVTAYPRCQEDCSEPARGLASVEALFVAYLLMGRSVDGLLDGYYWKELFLERNAAALLAV